MSEYYDLGPVIVCGPGPTREARREEMGDHWCFRCRKRVPFVFTVHVEIEPSYYGPTPAVRCVPAGHYDGDCGFGRYRAWGEDE